MDKDLPDCWARLLRDLGFDEADGESDLREALREAGCSPDDLVDRVLALFAAARPASSGQVFAGFIDDRFSPTPRESPSGGGGYVRWGIWTLDDGTESEAVVKTITAQDMRWPGTEGAPPEIDIVRRLRSLAGCPASNLVEYVAVGFRNQQDKANGVWSVVMPAALGTLQDLLGKGSLGERHPVCRGVLAEEQTARLLLVLSRVLEFCQANPDGIACAHRDLKPANILLYPASTGEAGEEVWCLDEGTAYRPVLADFGTARAIDPATGHGATTVGLAGTTNYMPAEQRTGGHFTHHVDHHALGVIAFECVTGRVPFDFAAAWGKPEETARLETQLRRSPPPPMSAAAGRRVALPFERIVRKLLQKMPAKRYDSAAHLGSDLRRFLAGQPVLARPLGQSLDDEDLKDGDPAYWAERRVKYAQRWMIAVGTVSALAVIGVVLWFLQGARSDARAQRIAKTKNMEEVASSYDRAAEPGMMAAVLGQSLVELRDADQLLADSLRVGIAMARSQLLPLMNILQVKGGVKACAISPDGRTAAVGTVGGFVYFIEPESGDFRLDQATGGELRYAAMPEGKDSDAVNSLAFRPDGKLLVAVANSGTMHFLDPATGREASAPVLSAVQPTAVSFSPDGRLILVSGTRKRGESSLVAYEAPSGRIAYELPVKHGLYAAAWSRDGKWLAAGGGLPPLNGLTVWPLRSTGEPPREPAQEFPQNARIATLAFHPTKFSTLLTGDFNGGLCLWDLVRQRISGAELRHHDSVRALAFSESGRWFLAGGEDGTARLFDFETRQPMGQRLTHMDQVRGGAVSESAGRIITGDFWGEVRIWDIRSLSRASRSLHHPGPVRAACFDAAGDQVLTGCNGGASGLGGGRVWRWREGGVTRLEHGADVLAARFRPGPDGQAVTGANDATAKVWDVRDGRLLQTLAHGRLVYCLDFFGNDRLALSGFGKVVRVFDYDGAVKLFKQSRTLEHGTASTFVWNCRWGREGHLLTSGGKEVCAWTEERSGWRGRTLIRLSRRLAETNPEMRLGAVNESGDRVVGADSLGRVTLACFDPAKDSLPLGGEEQSPHDTGRICADFKEAGAPMLATGGADGSVRLWGLDGEPVRPSPSAGPTALAHPSAVEVVRFSSDGRWLATGCQDGGVRLWSATTFAWTGGGWYHRGPVTCLRFSPDSKHLLSAGRDGVARVVPIPSPERGSARMLLAALEADAGIETTLIDGGTGAAFTAPRPLTAEAFKRKREARARLVE